MIEVELLVVAANAERKTDPDHRRFLGAGEQPHIGAAARARRDRLRVEQIVGLISLLRSRCIRRVGGLQVRVDNGFDASEASRISFALPGTDFGVHAQIEVAWSDNQGNVGIRFVKMASLMKSTLRLWLAQQYFSN